MRNSHNRVLRTLEEALKDGNCQRAQMRSQQATRERPSQRASEPPAKRTSDCQLSAPTFALQLLLGK